MNEPMGQPKRARKVLLFIAEYLVGAGIIYWLLHRNILDLSPLRSISLPLVLGGASLALAMTYLASVRLKYLLRDQGIRITIRRCFFFNCMAIFYSMFLPGGFSGDAARAYYLLREVGHNRAALLGSLLLDRILGLLAMIGLGTASSAFLVVSNPWLMTYFIYLSALFVLGLAFLGYLLFAQHRPDKGRKRNFIVRIYEFVHNLLVRLNIGAHSGKTLAYAVGLSIAIHSLSIFLIYVCSMHNDSGLGLLGVFSVGPFGLLANAIPISPGGLGVGEQSFEFLYRVVGGRNGASSFLTARIFLYSPAVIGALVAAVLFLRLHKVAGLGKPAGR
jgi:glycosyltransferase 2 family protein